MDHTKGNTGPPDEPGPPLDGGVSGLTMTPPSATLACMLSDLDIAQLDTYDLVTVIQTWERLKAYVDAQQMHAMSRLATDELYQRCDHPQDLNTGHTHSPIDPCGDELSLALTWSPGRAKMRLVTAIDLANDLPDTLVALRNGLIYADKAGLIADRTRCLATPAQRRDVEAQALKIAARKTRGQLDTMLRRAVMMADPAAAEQRRALAADGRCVSRPQPAAAGAEDGMAFMSVYGPAEDRAALFTAIDAAARHARGAGDERTLEQLRFDVLTGLGWAGLNAGHLGCCTPGCVTTNSTLASAATAGDAPSHWRLARRHNRAAAVNVTVPVSTLLGVAELPGWLDGFGPIAANAARRIATEGPWRRLLTDPADGQVLEYGRTIYTPPAHLAGFVAARDRTCQFPSCDHPARDTEIDHKRPYALGGTTGAANLWALHKAHHVSKTLHGHRVHTDTAGNAWWITPAGLRYRVDPETIGPITSSAEQDAPSPHTEPERPPF